MDAIDVKGYVEALVREVGLTLTEKSKIQRENPHAQILRVMYVGDHMVIFFI